MRHNMILFNNLRFIFYSILNLKWEKKVFSINSYMSVNSRRNIIIVWKRYLRMFPFCHFKLGLWTSGGFLYFIDIIEVASIILQRKKDFFLQALYHHLLYIHYFELAFSITFIGQRNWVFSISIIALKIPTNFKDKTIHNPQGKYVYFIWL